jgi:hypothetical protein
VPKRRTTRKKKPTRRPPRTDENLLAQFVELVRDDLLDSVAATIEHHDLDDALDIVDELVDVPPGETEMAAAMFQVHLHLLGEWLMWVSEAGADPVAAVGWTVENLGASQAKLARELSGLLDAPFVEAITMDEAVERSSGMAARGNSEASAWRPGCRRRGCHPWEEAPTRRHWTQRGPGRGEAPRVPLSCPGYGGRTGGPARSMG